MSILAIYTTCADIEEARRIAAALVTERIVACANIMNAHEAHYIWLGQTEQSSEVAILCKTAIGQFESVRTRIRQLHSYTTPAIVGWELQSDPEYEDWVRKAIG